MIIGAGFAGLIAAHVFPRLPIVEAAMAPEQMHRALLRFRTESVSKLTGIPFKAVTVRKGIFVADAFVQPDIQLANMYARKCLGRIVGDRSIWSMDAATRYIAPENFYEQLLDAVGHRVKFGQRIDFLEVGTPSLPYAISTAPMPLVLEALGVPCDALFKREPIRVRRYRVANCDAYQTIYYPSLEHSLYRASITGDLLICEFAGDGDDDTNGDIDGYEFWTHDLVSSFGLRDADLSYIDEVHQKYGKIAPIDNVERKRMIYNLTVEHGIFSLGRFAVWRNILLDDVVEDAAIVKRLLTASAYERHLSSF